MSSIFVDENKKVTINIYHNEIEGETLSFSEEVFKANVDKKDQENWEKNSITFRYPTYKDNVELSNRAFSVTDNGVALNTQLISFMRIIILIESWTFKDNDGSIEITEENISKLHPSLGMTIAGELERALGLLDEIAY